MARSHGRLTRTRQRGPGAASRGRPAPVRATFLAITFLGLSALDLVLTLRLLQTPGECFYEANPVASSILEWGGWWGLGIVVIAGGGGAAGLLVTFWSPARTSE